MYETALVRLLEAHAKRNGITKVTKLRVYEIKMLKERLCLPISEGDGKTIDIASSMIP